MDYAQIGRTATDGDKFIKNSKNKPQSVLLDNGAEMLLKNTTGATFSNTALQTIKNQATQQTQKEKTRDRLRRRLAENTLLKIINKEN
tara:strand:+ start:3256 stop:3519 length:264 start_codon:yes stop_codon:yes gene_type:complete